MNVVHYCGSGVIQISGINDETAKKLVSILREQNIDAAYMGDSLFYHGRDVKEVDKILSAELMRLRLYKEMDL